MVDHCLTIEDRQQRTACAHTIHKAMLTLFPSQENQENYRRKLWDHLALMSDFKLDIDWPVEISPDRSRSRTRTNSPYPAHTDRWRQYGNEVRMLIDCVLDMPEGDERDTLTMLLANQMKNYASKTIPTAWTTKRFSKTSTTCRTAESRFFPSR